MQILDVAVSKALGIDADEINMLRNQRRRSGQSGTCPVSSQDREELDFVTFVPRNHSCKSQHIMDPLCGERVIVTKGVGCRLAWICYTTRLASIF